MNTRSRRALVLVFDRLNPGFLGPYGNTWIDTPATNRLAAQSTLYEFALANSPDIPSVYQSYWTGIAPGISPSSGPGPALAELLGNLGRSSELIADESEVLHHPGALAFSDRLSIEVDPPTTLASDLEETQLAQFFAATIERALASDAPDLLWCHTAAFNVAWDAPRAFRERFVESGDPPPLDICRPAHRDLSQDYDPDELLGIVQAYAGQIAAWDACLDAWLDAITDHAAAENLLLVVTSPRGYPLGEHLRIGPCDEPLYGELLQIPLFVCDSQGAGRLERRPALVQPQDLFATLIDWFGGQVPATAWGESLVPTADPATRFRREFAWATAANQWAIRTPAWFYRKSPERDELFAKPDDRWEVNELARRCPDVIEQLEMLREAIGKCEAYAALPPLVELLRHL